MEKHAPCEHPLHELIARRWSPRTFSPRAVEREKLLSLVEAMRWAPSSFNEQPWGVLVATHEEPEHFARLLGCISEFNRGWAAKAPVLMLAAAKRVFTRNGRVNPHAAHDLGLALGNLTLQATALDLFLHMIAGFDAEHARTACGIPDDHDAIVMLALGYVGSLDDLPPHLRDKETAPRSRRPLSEFVFSSTWDARAPWLPPSAG